MTKRQAIIQMSKPISVQCNSIYVVQVQIDIVRTIQFEYLVFLFVCVVSSNHAIGYKCRNRVTCSHYNSLALSSGLVSSRGDRDKHSLVSVSEHSSGRHTLSLSLSTIQSCARTIMAISGPIYRICRRNTGDHWVCT
jgi:hypothetical protein